MSFWLLLSLAVVGALAIAQTALTVYIWVLLIRWVVNK